MWERIIGNILIFLSIYLFPWWLVSIFLLIGLFLFKKFYEVFFFALLIDLTYGTGALGFLSFSYTTLAFFIIVFFLIEATKKRLKFYPNSI